MTGKYFAYILYPDSQRLGTLREADQFNVPFHAAFPGRRVGNEKASFLRKPCPDLAWNRNKTQALIAMRRLLSQMDSGDARVKDLRRQLDFLFPPEFASNETIRSPQ